MRQKLAAAGGCALLDPSSETASWLKSEERFSAAHQQGQFFSPMYPFGTLSSALYRVRALLFPDLRPRVATAFEQDAARMELLGAERLAPWVKPTMRIGRRVAVDRLRASNGIACVGTLSELSAQVSPPIPGGPCGDPGAIVDRFGGRSWPRCAPGASPRGVSADALRRAPG